MHVALAHLVLEDGTVYTGRAFGSADPTPRAGLSGPVGGGGSGTITDTGMFARATALGEAVFNTALTGYQEVLTDPSYNQQIVALTAPEVGVTGVNDDDMESARIQVAGFVVRHLTRTPSSWRATRALDAFLHDAGVPGIEGIDTRALTRHLRTRGAMRAAIGPAAIVTPTELLQLARQAPQMSGADLTGNVTCVRAYTHEQRLDTRWYSHAHAPGKPSPFTLEPSRAGTSGRSAAVDAAAPTPRASVSIVAYDFGLKASILRHLAARGCRVEVVPADTPAGAVLERKPAAVFLSNGPGDPAACGDIIAEVRELLGRVPVGAICLGHQLAALALGAETFKLTFGHRGANHPVRNLESGGVIVTGQNHGFAVSESSIDRGGFTLTHLSLNDGTVEGLAHSDLPYVGVQFHPEANPGPHEAHAFFDRFLAMCG